MSFQNERSKTDNLFETMPQAQSSSRSTSSTSLSITSNSGTSTNLDCFVIKTINLEKKNIDLQIAKFIYSTNSSFRLVKHKEFKKMIHLLRQGYKPPSRYHMANELLDNFLFP